MQEYELTNTSRNVSEHLELDKLGTTETVMQGCVCLFNQGRQMFSE